MTAVLAAGFILLAVAAVSGLVITAPGWPRGVPYVAGAAGAGCLAVAGGFALSGRTVALNVAGWLGDPLPGQQALGLAADRLSGLFLVMAFGAAAGVSVAFASWAVRPDRPAVFPRMLAAGYALALGSVAVVMTATDAFTALFGWEALTVAFYLLAGANARDRDRAGAARITVAFGKVSGAALLIGLLLLATRSHSIALASFAHVPGGAARTTALVLLLAGFAVKAGLVPFQVWLPRGYAAAPGPARAVMAGVCVNVGFYGMWRTLALLGRPPGWLAGVLLLLGGLTALLGIAHAAVSSRLSRVIAYSSVENTGLIVTGFGVALTGAAVGDRRLIAVGLLAATLQMVAHTAAKSLLFCSSAGLEATAGGGDDLEVLRGVGRRAPWSGWGLAVGAVTLAGLPPTAGFVSEWFLLESLMQQFRVTALAGRLTLALAGAAVALTVGFAGVTFVRLVGMVVLGPGRQRSSPGRLWLGRAHGDRVAVGLPAGAGGADAAGDPGDRRRAVPGRARRAHDGRAEVAVGAAAGVRRVLDPVAVLAVGGASADARAGRPARARPVRAAAAAGAAGSRVAFGDDGRGGRGLLHGVRLRQPDPAGAGERAAHAGRGGGGRTADGDGDQVPHLRYASDVVEVVETWLYRPVIRLFGAAVAYAKRLQSGRLDAYLLYMLIALVAVIAVVTALA